MVKNMLDINEKKQLILEAALKVIVHEKGMLPTKKVGAQAGISEATVFHYFKTKEMLLKALLHYLMEDFQLHCKKCGLYNTDKGMDCIVLNIPIRQRLRILWDVYLDWGIEHALQFKALQFLDKGKDILVAFLEEQLCLFSRSEALFFQEEPDKENILPSWYFKFVSGLFMAAVNTTLETILRMPEPYARRYLREMGFLIFVSGLLPNASVNPKERSLEG
ncbi:TetR/AcrR family transcriptional regulator [Acetobacteraceae bacterium]|nr:TetR/AcrR family transcriptional regulator [Acetobacteraceae bacterium]